MSAEAVSIDLLTIKHHPDMLEVEYRLIVNQETLIRRFELMVDGKLFWAEGNGGLIPPGIYHDIAFPIFVEPLAFSPIGHFAKMNIINDSIILASKEIWFMSLGEIVSALIGGGVVSTVILWQLGVLG